MVKETEPTKTELIQKVDTSLAPTTEVLDLISDDALIGVYEEIMGNFRTDRDHVSVVGS